MYAQLFTKSLLVTALVISTLGCSKKEDAPAATPAVGTGSYTVTGSYNETVSGQSRAYTSSRTQGNQTTSVLQIIITDTPQFQSNKTKQLELIYEKPAGQPNSAYQLTGSIVYTDYGQPGSISGQYTNKASTLTEPSSGVFTGVISATNVGTIQGKIEGSFTQARL